MAKNEMKKINSRWFDKFIGVDFGDLIYLGPAIDYNGRRQYIFLNKESKSEEVCYYKEACQIMGAMIEAYRNKR